MNTKLTDGEIERMADPNNNLDYEWGFEDGKHGRQANRFLEGLPQYKRGFAFGTQVRDGKRNNSGSCVPGVDFSKQG